MVAKNLKLGVLLLPFFLATVFSQQQHSLEYRCLQKPNKRIELKLTNQANEAKSFYDARAGAGATKCDNAIYALNGDTFTLDISNDASLPCGVEKVQGVGNTYEVKLSTSGCADANCILGSDTSFAFICDFDNEITQDINTPFQTSGTIKAGKEAAKLEDIALTVVAGSDTLDAGSGPNTPLNTIALGEEIKLQAKLTTSGVNAIRIVSCFAHADGDTANKIDFITAGCGAAEYNFIDSTVSFTKDDATVGEYTTLSPKFNAFKFLAGDNVNFICTAQLCTDVATCAPQACSGNGRRRRSADETKNATVLVTLRVKTDSSSFQDQDRPTPTVLGHECNNRSYLIGLGIMGGVLALTFILTVAMFVMLRRGLYGNSNKQGLDNKAMY